MSNWAPASATRGLLRPPDASAPANRLPDKSVPPTVEPESFPDRFDEDIELRDKLRRGRRPMSAGAKLAMIGGAFLLALLVPSAAIFIAMIAGKSHGTRSYTVELRGVGVDDSRQVEFQRNERVHITVTTEQWGGPFEPDVDLFVLDPTGNVIAQDTLPDKDCEVRFVANQPGRYRIVVVLDDGIWAKCTVRY
jgi:hypothetical protein